MCNVLNVVITCPGRAKCLETVTTVLKQPGSLQAALGEQGGEQDESQQEAEAGELSGRGGAGAGCEQGEEEALPRLHGERVRGELESKIARLPRR